MDDLFPMNNERQPIVVVKGGEVFANSRDVAAYFEKRHDLVIRDVRNLVVKEPSLGLLNFAETPYVDAQNGQTYQSFDMDRRGFTLLAMGFTGDKALKWKLRYIDAFEAMEAELRKQNAPISIDVRDPGQLTKIAIQLIEVNKELSERVDLAEAKVEAAKPKTQFFDLFANAEGLYGLQNAARVLGRNPNKFISHLKQGYLFYQGGSLVPKVQFRERGIFEVKCTYVDDKARYQTFVTPKGIQYFAKKLGGDGAALEKTG